jgi:hypothetical protein
MCQVTVGKESSTLYPNRTSLSFPHFRQIATSYNCRREGCWATATRQLLLLSVHWRWQITQLFCVYTRFHTHTLFLLRIPLSIEEKVDDSMQNKDDSVSLCDSIDSFNVYVALAVDALRTDLYV